MMKKTVLALCLVACMHTFVQAQETAGAQYYKRIFEYDFVERKPIFAAGADSLRNYYLSHFNFFDTLVTYCINNGDTSKYIRVHFEFVLDENGVAYEPKFSYVGTTRYGSSSGDKKVKYLDEFKTELNDAVKVMVKYMPTWRPALQNNVRVSCRVESFFQLWLGRDTPN